MRTALLSVTCALLGAPAAAVGAPDGVAGVWDSPLGRIRLVRDGHAVRGTVVQGSPPCRFRAGEEVLRGTLVDDSLAGQMKVCLTGPGCARSDWANALLLIGPRKWSGAVHVGPAGCLAPLGKKGGVTLTAARARPTPPKPAAAARARARALLRDGAAWLGEGNFEEARGRFLEALEHDPQVPEALNGVGVTYRMRNDLPAALRWYKKALAVDPDFGDAYYNMACAYALQGERTLALRYLQIAAINGYATAEGIDGDSDLASLRPTREYRALRDRM